MRKNLINRMRISLYAAIVLAMALSSCSDEAGSMPEMIDISGNWLLVRSDIIEAAGLYYDDSGDTAISIPGQWTKVLLENEDLVSTVWLRKRVVIPRVMSKYPLICALGEIGVADEVYFNGVRIGGKGQIPPGKDPLNYRIAWKNPRHYLIPSSLIRFDRENLIAVRVFSHVFNGVTGKQGIVAQYGGFPNQFIFDYIPAIINLIALSLNTVFLFIFLLLFLASRKRVVYIYFAMILIAGIVFNLAVVNSPVPVDGLVRFKVLFAAYAAISFFITLAMQEIFRIRFRYSTAVLTAMAVLVAVTIIASPTTKFLVIYCGLATLLAAVLWQGYSVFIFFTAVTRDIRRYWLLVLLVPVGFSAFRNAYYLIRMDFNSVHGSIFLHIPMLMYVIILYLFYDYEYEKRSGESVYRSLLRKSQRLQRDLNRAKKVDARPDPQERIHDLISYLDGNFSETYNRRELSRRFNLNENYMVQLFKRTTGETISGYINARRIDSARKLIAETESRIIDIAFHVGFDNYTHFHRLFRKMTGMTPKDYRLKNNPGA